MIKQEVLDAIHERMLRGDVPASSELFRLAHSALAAALRKKVGTALSWEEIGDLATDAIVTYVNAPEKFDPSRSGLFGYLLMMAHRDALNFLRDRGGDRKKISRLVELSGSDGNTLQEAPDVKLDADSILKNYRDEIVREEGDEAVLRLYLEGERETAAYAEVLGLMDKPIAEQRRRVKVRKDRIEQRIKRLQEVLK